MIVIDGRKPLNHEPSLASRKTRTGACVVVKEVSVLVNVKILTIQFVICPNFNDMKSFHARPPTAPTSAVAMTMEVPFEGFSAWRGIFACFGLFLCVDLPS